MLRLIMVYIKSIVAAPIASCSAIFFFFRIVSCKTAMLMVAGGKVPTALIRRATPKANSISPGIT